MRITGQDVEWCERCHTLRLSEARPICLACGLPRRNADMPIAESKPESAVRRVVFWLLVVVGGMVSLCVGYWDHLGAGR
jgi:hypothetical protein